MDLKKTISLKSFFSQFLIVLLFLLFIGASVPIVLLVLGVNSGFLLPANISEMDLQKVQADIQGAPNFCESHVPPGIEYVLLSKSLNPIEGNMNEADTKRAIEYAAGKYNNSIFRDRYTLLTREKEYVVLKYSLRPRYASVKLNSLLPQPEILCLILIGLNLILACLTTTLYFAAGFKKQLAPLHDAAIQIGKENLDFEVPPSRIRELNEVLLSLETMKEELKNSLEKQWNDEQQQREQIAALAHDLKTPLTVLFGNLDLLQETDGTKEQKQYLFHLAGSAGQIKQHIENLIELSQTSATAKLQITETDPGEFLTRLREKTLALASLKDIQTKFCFQNFTEKFHFDKDLLERALLNIVANAVDFTPPRGTILFEAGKRGNNFVIIITDSGEGFSPRALQKGKERFFMDKPGRPSRHHYGMGLTIADQIIKQHKGTLSLANGRKDLAGAEITISIPV